MKHVGKKFAKKVQDIFTELEEFLNDHDMTIVGTEANWVLVPYNYDWAERKSFYFNNTMEDPHTQAAIPEAYRLPTFSNIIDTNFEGNELMKGNVEHTHVEDTYTDYSNTINFNKNPHYREWLQELRTGVISLLSKANDLLGKRHCLLCISHNTGDRCILPRNVIPCAKAPEGKEVLWDKIRVAEDIDIPLIDYGGDGVHVSVDLLPWNRDFSDFTLNRDFR